MRTRIAVAFLAVALAGCSVERLPISESPPPSASTPAPSPLAPPATPQATIPSDLPLSTTVEGVGMRLTFTLERNAMPAGEPTWMTTTVENVGDRLAMWSASCGHAVSVFGTVPDIRLRYGRQGIDEVGRMKDRIMASARIEDGVMHLGFSPKSAVDGGLEVGEYGCADIFDGRELKPGATIVERSRWSGFAMRSRMPPPTAAVPLQGRFRWWWQPVDGPGPELGPGSELEAVLDAWVEGSGAPIRIHPGEAVDSALADPVFGPWLLARPRSGVSAIVEFDPARGVWRVGMTTHNPVQRDRVALVDAATGEILAIVGPID